MRFHTPGQRSDCHPPPNAMAKLQELHRAAGLLAEDLPEVITHPEVAHGLEQALIQAMTACLDTGDAQEDTSAQRRHKTIMRRFYASLEADSDRPLYVLELATKIGVSVRSLSTCCHEFLGVGPKAYLLRRRMHLARQALIVADPSEMTVTNVATQYGFWQFGGFAGEYKSLFGELPSVTLCTEYAMRSPYRSSGRHTGLSRNSTPAQ
jgi:transcriptional regulator GlxA family with amidase domain